MLPIINSSYPVILSIENHCTQEQQKKMATYFRSYLGGQCFETGVVDNVSFAVIYQSSETSGNLCSFDHAASFPEYYCDDPVEDLTELPSPEQLKYKILIKVRKLCRRALDLFDARA